MSAMTLEPTRQLPEAELSDLLAGSAELVLAICSERARLQERLAALSVGRHELECAVARAREAVARGRRSEQEIERLEAVMASLRRELTVR